jgi:hypothetical protein
VSLPPVTLANGHTFQIIDRGDRINAIETGPSNVKHPPPALTAAYPDLWHAHRLSDLIAKGAPDVTVPTEYASLERDLPTRPYDPSKLKTLAEMADLRAAAATTNRATASFNHTQDQIIRNLNPENSDSTWCGTFCCDSNEIDNLCWQNLATNANWTYFNFEYGYGYADIYDTPEVSALMCPIDAPSSYWLVEPTDGATNPTFNGQVNRGNFEQWDTIASFDSDSCCYGYPGCTPYDNGGLSLCWVISEHVQANSGSDERNMTFCGSSD